MRKHIHWSSLAMIGLVGSLVLSCEKGSGSSPKPTPTASASTTTAATVASVKPTAASTAVQGPFEGEIDLRLEKPNEKGARAVVYEVKADKVRYEEGGANSPAYAIANLGQKKAFAVVDNHRDYAEVNTDASSLPTAGAVQVKRTGKMEKIAGLDCEDWQMTTTKEELDVCAAREIGYFDLINPTVNTVTEPAWAIELTKAKAFPLRLIERDKSGKEQFRAEATKISRKPMEVSRFDVPAGYHKVAMSKETAVFGIQ